MNMLFSEQIEAVHDERRRSPLPPQPATIEETGLNFQFLLELLTKALFLRGQLPLVDAIPVSVGKLPYAVAIAAGTVGFFAWQRVG